MDLSGAHLEGADLSSADFTGAVNPDQATFTDAWAWSDMPPQGLPDIILFTLCQYRDGMDRFTRPDPCIAPD
ncbi:pentapeptide repeat-containing protein [Rhodobacter maris]|uniref:Pentapeptide repeat protein n=1 Tax=Rhodobacter maris TaxID=446682 RepID=A0A285RJM2_9RHOB|nr:pentapeptide repeat-containing protein [Rhodobacter maris]SOB92602.1 pentapeptide repeat protein [Rhodobacter maris]